jgi:hypothetical protein
VRTLSVFLCGLVVAIGSRATGQGTGPRCFTAKDYKTPACRAARDSVLRVLHRRHIRPFTARDFDTIPADPFKVTVADLRDGASDREPCLNAKSKYFETPECHAARDAVADQWDFEDTAHQAQTAWKNPFEPHQGQPHLPGYDVPPAKPPMTSALGDATIGVLALLLLAASFFAVAFLVVRRRDMMTWLWVPRRLVGVGLLLMAFAGLFPPWKATWPPDFLRSERPCGVASPIWSPPPSQECLRPGFASPGFVHVDLARLLLEWAVLAGLTAALPLIASSKKS